MFSNFAPQAIIGKRNFVHKIKSTCSVSLPCQANDRPCHKILISCMEPSLCDRLFPISKLKEYWRLFERNKSNKSNKLNDIKMISVLQS